MNKIKWRTLKVLRKRASAFSGLADQFILSSNFPIGGAGALLNTEDPAFSKISKMLSLTLHK